MPFEVKTNIVYQLSCENCDSDYIGETEEKVSERVIQPVATVRNKNKYL